MRRRSVVVDPGPVDDGPPRRGRGRGGRGGASCCSPTTTPTTPRPPASSPSGWGAACARWTRRTAWAPRASATATWSRSTGSRCASSRTPGHTADSLSFLLPAERRGAHRRHRAGPRHHRGGAPGRPARRLPRLAGPAARARRGARGRHDLAGPRPGDRRRARRAGLLHRAPRASGWRRSRPPSRSWRRGAEVPSATTCPAGSSRSSTPTSTRCSGVPPSCRCGRSWPT